MQNTKEEQLAEAGPADQEAKAEVAGPGANRQQAQAPGDGEYPGTEGVERAGEAQKRQGFLAKETRELKEKLLAEVDELIERQNRVEPTSKLETFQVETASRRVLRELAEDFHRARGHQDLKIKEISNAQEYQKRRIDTMEHVVKKLTVQLTESMKYGNRIMIAEKDIVIMKEQNDKRHESSKEYVVKLKEMLESRVDQITTFENNIETVSLDVKKLSNMHIDSEQKLIKEIGLTNSANLVIRNDLDRHLEAYTTQHINAQFYQDKNDSWQKATGK